MAVVKRNRFASIVDRNYVKARKQLFEQAQQVLQHEKMRESIEGYCNSALSKHMAVAVQLALQNGSTVVKFELSTSKHGQTLWKHWPVKIRQQVPVDLIVISIELLLMEAGYQVSPVEHLCRYEQELNKDVVEAAEVVEEEEEEEEKEDEGGEGQSIDQLLSETPALTGPVAVDDLAGET